MRRNVNSTLRLIGTLPPFCRACYPEGLLLIKRGKTLQGGKFLSFIPNIQLLPQPFFFFFEWYKLLICKYGAFLSGMLPKGTRCLIVFKITTQGTLRVLHKGKAH